MVATNGKKIAASSSRVTRWWNPMVSTLLFFASRCFVEPRYTSHCGRVSRRVYLLELTALHRPYRAWLLKLLPFLRLYIWRSSLNSLPDLAHMNHSCWFCAFPRPHMHIYGVVAGTQCLAHPISGAVPEIPLSLRPRTPYVVFYTTDSPTPPRYHWLTHSIAWSFTHSLPRTRTQHTHARTDTFPAGL